MVYYTVNRQTGHDYVTCCEWNSIPNGKLKVFSLSFVSQGIPSPGRAHSPWPELRYRSLKPVHSPPPPAAMSVPTSVSTPTSMFSLIKFENAIILHPFLNDGFPEYRILD